MTEYLRSNWRILRMYRTKNSFLFDYRILQNISHIERARA